MNLKSLLLAFFLLHTMLFLTSCSEEEVNIETVVEPDEPTPPDTDGNTDDDTPPDDNDGGDNNNDGDDNDGDNDDGNDNDGDNDDGNDGDDGNNDNPPADADLILQNLTDSKDVYTAATDGQWIQITESEYNALASNLSDIAKSGLVDSEIVTSSNVIQTTSSPSTLSNETQTAVIPTGHYLFAFKYYAVKAQDQPGLKVKVSNTTNTNGYEDIGAPFPKHSGENQEVFFVLKNSSNVSNQQGYLALFKPAGLVMGRKTSVDENSYFIELGDNTSISDRSDTPLKLLYQGLTTGTKQW